MNDLYLFSLACNIILTTSGILVLACQPNTFIAFKGLPLLTIISDGRSKEESLTIYFSDFNQDSLNNITFYTDIVKQNKLSEIHNIAKADKAGILWKSKSKHSY